MLFDEELRAALDQLRTAPQLGSFYRVTTGQEHRRLLLPKTRYHVYYRVVISGVVQVVAVWSALRGRGPRI
jgi:plasmid stabilization system protein ParE